MKNSPAYFCLVMALLVSNVVLVSNASEMKTGGKVPELETFSLMGLPVSVIPPEGKIQYILFWNVSQVKSGSAVKDAIVLYKRFHDNGLDVITICDSSSEEPVIQFSDRWLLPFPIIMNGEEEPEITRQFGVTDTPHSFLIDSKGTVLAVNPDRDELHKKVAELLSVSLDDLPMPPAPAAREQNRGGMGTVPGQNGGILLAGETFQVNDTLIGTTEERKEAEACKKNLRKISLALKRYRMEHGGQLPEWLSDLYPKYIDDKNVFLDPNHPEPQTDWENFADPKIPCSFTYEFAPNGKRYKTSQLKEYGDKVPVVRSLYKYVRPLNLSYGGEIYFSQAVMWEDDFAPNKSLNDPDAKARQQLLKIAVALDDYKKDHGEVPNELHELIPDYVENETAIQIPGLGVPFQYEFSPNKENRQEPALGSNYREWKTKQMEEFGDLVPIVRAGAVLRNRRYLNLGYGGEIWESDSLWERNLRGNSVMPASRTRMTIARNVQQGMESTVLADADWPDEPLQDSVTIDNATQMIPLKGQWTLVEGNLRQNLTNVSQTILLFQPYLKHGEITFKAKAVNGSEGLRIVFGFTGPDRFFVWNIGGWDNTVSVVEKWSNIYGSTDKDLTGRKDYVFSHNEWHKIRLVISPDSHTARGYIDGQEIMTWKSEEKLDGRLGLSTWLTAVEFEEIEIAGK